MGRTYDAMTHLYYKIMEDLPKITSYNQMIKDSRDESSEEYKLDNYLRKQIQDKYGEVMLSLLAFENLLVKSVSYVDNETDSYIKNDYLS